ncbi:MAG: NB-ARC domain-containing protein, partial [Chloroflexota bacterium]
MTLFAQVVPVLSNLPAPITPLIGRRTEMQTLDHLLGERETRMITVLAPGGMGKTLLALEVARKQLQRFADGVYFVTVTESINTEHLASLIADVMRWQYAPGRDMQRELLDFLRQRELLLLVDNAEFAIDAAPYLTAILASAPAVKILATSRVKLNLYTETPFPLGGLAHSAETKDTAAEIEAVELFAQRAKNVRPDFQLTPQSRLAIEEICRLTQGMPLALVLAASWMALLSPEEIAREIRH